MTEATTISDLKFWHESLDYSKLASFFTDLTGSAEKARSTLEGVMGCLPGGCVVSDSQSRKRATPDTATLPAQAQVSNQPSYFARDMIDDSMITVLTQIPNDKSVIGAIIGPHGKHIKQITESTGCVVNLDQKNQSAKNGTSPITVFFQGPLRSVVKAVDLMSSRLETVISEWAGSADWASTGSGINRTVMIIPDSLVKRVIGKGGTTVTKLQADSRAQVQLQSEAKMLASLDPLFGREALLTGSLASRLHALYLIGRMLLEDKESPVVWKTQNMFPTSIRGGQSPSGGLMTAKGVFNLASAPAPPLPQQLYQHPQQHRQHPQQQQYQQQQQQPQSYNPQHAVQVYQTNTGMGVLGGGPPLPYGQFQGGPQQAPIQPPGKVAPVAAALYNMQQTRR
jgi:hypothetical protein